MGGNRKEGKAGGCWSLLQGGSDEFVTGGLESGLVSDLVAAAVKIPESFVLAAAICKSQLEFNLLTLMVNLVQAAAT